MMRKTTTAPQTTTTEASAAEGAEQQFLRLMSHEMRTPLNGVIGMLGLLSRTRLDGAQRAYLDAARSSAEHLLGLVNDLLDYARIEAALLELDSAPVDLEGLVRGVAELLSPRAHEKGLEIAWSVACRPSEFRAGRRSSSSRARCEAARSAGDGRDRRARRVRRRYSLSFRPRDPADALLREPPSGGPPRTSVRSPGPVAGCTALNSCSRSSTACRYASCTEGMPA